MGFLGDSTPNAPIVLGMNRRSPNSVAAERSGVFTLEINQSVIQWTYNVKIGFDFRSNRTTEVESRTQRSRPRTQKQIRGQGRGPTFRGQTLLRQGQKWLRPRTKDANFSKL